MSAWPTVPLGELAKPKQWPTLSKIEMMASGFPVYGANGRIGHHDTFTHERPTILIGCRGSCGTVHVTEPKSYANGNAMALDDLDESRADLGFLVQFFRQRGFRDVTSGTSQPQIIRQNIVRVEIPLPPLEEQRWIAEILDKTDALRAKRRAALTQLDFLTQSIFLDLFGDPATNPKGWPAETVAELCTPRANGCIGGPFGSDLTQADYVEAPGVPVIRGHNLATNAPFLDEDGFVFISEAKAHALSRNIARRGDILVSQRGARLAGQVAIVPPNSRFEKYIVSQSQMRVSPDLSKVDPLYLVYYFRSPRAIQRMEALTISTGVPHINLSILREFLVELPGLSLQREFACRVTAVEKLKATQRASLAELDALFASLQHRAFRGEL